MAANKTVIGDGTQQFPIYVRLCQEDIVKNDLLMKSIIQDIRKCDGPESYLEKLNYDVKKIIKDLKQHIEALETIAKEEDKESDKILLLQEVEKHNKELASNYKKMREANLSSHMLILKKNQELLFDSEGSEVRRRMHAKDNLVKVSSGITESLQSLTHKMVDRVTQSEQTMQTLVGTSSTVDETHEEYHGMSGVIHQSRKLLTKYNRREVTDKVVIFLAIAFFFACVLYVVTKRIL